MTETEFREKFPRLNAQVPAGYLEQVFEFAEKRGLTPNLVAQLEQLSRLGSFGGEVPTEVRLWKDHAPFSFEFAIYSWSDLDRTKEPKFYMNGGLIYHGKGEQGETTLSVRFDTNECWQLHT